MGAKARAPAEAPWGSADVLQLQAAFHLIRRPPGWTSRRSQAVLAAATRPRCRSALPSASSWAGGGPAPAAPQLYSSACSVSTHAVGRIRQVSGLLGSLEQSGVGSTLPCPAALRKAVPLTQKPCCHHTPPLTMTSSAPADSALVVTVCWKPCTACRSLAVHTMTGVRTASTHASTGSAGSSRCACSAIVARSMHGLQHSQVASRHAQDA